MTELIIAAVVGVALGIGGTVGVIQLTKPKEPIQLDDKVARDQQKIIKQLTTLDLVKPVCDPKYIQEQGSDLLCRELTCLQYSRGVDSQTGGAQCESISNVANKIEILRYCGTDAKPEECLEIFWRRN